MCSGLIFVRCKLVTSCVCHIVDASQFLEYDIYELPGENRLFYIIHMVDYLWDKAGSFSYIFLGQLTTDLLGTITVHVS